MRRMVEAAGVDLKSEVRRTAALRLTTSATPSDRPKGGRMVEAAGVEPWRGQRAKWLMARDFSG
jgi:hypothetical protein